MIAREYTLPFVLSHSLPFLIQHLQSSKREVTNSFESRVHSTDPNQHRYPLLQGTRQKDEDSGNRVIHHYGSVNKMRVRSNSSVCIGLANSVASAVPFCTRVPMTANHYCRGSPVSA